MKLINIMLIIILSFIVGTLYYFNMSLSMSKETNCSFSANIWTDIGAFVFGFIILYMAVIKYDDEILLFVAISIITEHIWQVIFNKL